MHNAIHIPKPDIFSFSQCLHFLDRNYDDCLYTVDKERVLKPLLIDGHPSLFEVTDTGDALRVTMLKGPDSKEALDAAARYVMEWFDMERDLRPFYQLLENHELLSGMGDDYYGLRLLGIFDLFEALCWCVIGQQINLAFAHKVKRKLVETYGAFITHDSKRHYFFPDVEVLADLEVKDLKALQFSRQKAEYVIGIANGFADGSLSKNELESLTNTHQMIQRLKEIRGVGDWTANYVLMKSLKRMDCITYGDTGLQSAVSSVLNLDRKPTADEVKAIFEPFSGLESYLNIYLWRTLS
jgi:DNA-3-methyladenine glycosylase II